MILKPNFNSEVDAYREEDYLIEVPRECELDDVESIHGFIEHDNFIIPYIDIEKHVFAKVVDDVLKLIHAQLMKLNENERQLNAILVVGGFGKSNYLLRKIQDRFGQKLIGAEVIGKPPDGDLAICKGAVSFGLDPRLVTEGMTRFSYGLQVKDKLSQRPDDPKQKIVGHDGNIYCQNVFSLIVSKESSLKKGHVYVQKVHVTYPNDPVFGKIWLI
jgi:hypothetical protein